MPKRGRKYKEVSEKIDNSMKYNFGDAIKLVLETKRAKFDEMVDIAVRLGVDPRHADQMVRGTVALPHGVGKVMEALEAGADFAGSDELIEKIQGGWLDFDKTIATPDMMGTVSKLGRVLGPRGMMPNAKLGTVTFDVARAVQDIKAGKIEFKVEKAGIVHAPMGKASFGIEKLTDNISAFMETIVRMKPSASKGTYLRTIALSTTMGPGVKIDPIYTKELSSR